LLLEEHRGSWWRRLVFLVRRKGGVMYGWDEGTPLLLLPACTLMVAEELRLLVMVAYWCRRLRRRNSTAGALAKPKFLGSGSLIIIEVIIFIILLNLSDPSFYSFSSLHIKFMIFLQ
jgi:hypothetical protein